MDRKPSQVDSTIESSISNCSQICTYLLLILSSISSLDSFVNIFLKGNKNTNTVHFNFVSMRCSVANIRSPQFNLWYLFGGLLVSFCLLTQNRQQKQWTSLHLRCILYYMCVYAQKPKIKLRTHEKWRQLCLTSPFHLIFVANQWSIVVYVAHNRFTN